MRSGLVLALALPLALALVPPANADTARGHGVGLDLGYVAPGTWDLYDMVWPSLGTLTLRLSADQPPAPMYADYDLYLYHEGSLDDSLLAESEVIARSTRAGGGDERIDAWLAAGTFVVAVAPWQTLAEEYTLTSSGGDLRYVGTTVGVGQAGP